MKVAVVGLEPPYRIASVAPLLLILTAAIRMTAEAR